MTTLITPTVPIIYGEAIRVAEPAMTAVALLDAIEHSRLPDSSAESQTIQRLLKTAVQAVENYTGLGLITQTWSQTWSALPTVLTLYRRPLQAIITVQDLSAGGSPLPTIDPDDYQVSGIGGAKVPATLRPVSSWPTLTDSNVEAVQVTYTVGFGNTPTSVPVLIQHAVLLTFGTFFDNREDADIPDGAKSLLRDWRPLAVA